MNPGDMEGAAAPINTEAELWTPEEFAAYLRVPERWVEKQIQARRVPGQVKCGRYWRVQRAAVEKQMLSGSVLLPKASTRAASPARRGQ